MRSVSVEARHIDLSELMIPEPKIEHVRTVEASLRLDSIASAGFRMSRGKMTDIVKAGDVRCLFGTKSPVSTRVVAT